jgi:PAB1-binding protein PBP1
VGGWDQFKANEQRFGLKSDYDENLYTTQIDRKNPLYAMREREAERIARDIESQTSTNAHIREERGIMDDGDDEEERYAPQVVRGIGCSNIV